MTQENIIVGVALVLGGALIIAVCVPLLKDQIKPNALYGIRLAKSFESDENWYKMNRFGARQMIMGAAAMMVCGLVAFFLPLHNNPILSAVVAFVPLLLLLVPALQIYRYSKTL